MSRRPPLFRKKRRKIRRPRPAKKIGPLREGYLRFLDFFDSIFPSPREIGLGEEEGELAMALHRVPVMIVYAPFYALFWVLFFLLMAPFFVLQAALSRPPSP